MRYSGVGVQGSGDNKIAIFVKGLVIAEFGFGAIPVNCLRPIKGFFCAKVLVVHITSRMMSGRRVNLVFFMVGINAMILINLGSQIRYCKCAL